MLSLILVTCAVAGFCIGVAAGGGSPRPMTIRVRRQPRRGRV
jgi:hypothetical protein